MCPLLQAWLHSSCSRKVPTGRKITWSTSVQEVRWVGMGFVVAYMGNMSMNPLNVPLIQILRTGWCDVIWWKRCPVQLVNKHFKGNLNILKESLWPTWGFLSTTDMKYVCNLLFKDLMDYTILRNTYPALRLFVASEMRHNHFVLCSGPEMKSETATNIYVRQILTHSSAPCFYTGASTTKVLSYRCKPEVTHLRPGPQITGTGAVLEKSQLCQTVLSSTHISAHLQSTQRWHSQMRNCAFPSQNKCIGHY